MPDLNDLRRQYNRHRRIEGVAADEAAKCLKAMKAEFERQFGRSPQGSDDHEFLFCGGKPPE